MAEAEGLQAIAAGRRAQGAKRRPAMCRAFVVARSASRLSHKEQEKQEVRGISCAASGRFRVWRGCKPEGLKRRLGGGLGKA